MQSQHFSHYLRTAFFGLVLANLLFFAWTQQVGPGEGHEPQRLKMQLEADKVRLVGAVPPEAEKAATPEVVTACHLYSGVPAGLARILQASLEQESSPIKVGMPSGKSMLYWVHIPPLANKAAVDKKLVELKQLGVDDATPMLDAGSQQFAISLGLFKNEHLANKYHEALSKKGVRSARLESKERGVIGDQEKIELELSGPEESLRALETSNSLFASLTPSDCKTP